MNVCNGIQKVAQIIVPDVLSVNFITTLTTLTKEAQWSVRMSGFKLVGELSKIFPKEIFQKQLEALFLSYLSNTATSVRETGIKKVKELA